MPYGVYFHHESEVIGGGDWFIMCHLDYCLENRLWTKVEAGKPVRRLLRKTMVIAAAEVVINDGLWIYFGKWGKDLLMVKEGVQMTNLALGWMDLSFLIWR